MFLGIAGPSGCGKSSLIKAICKLEKCDGDIAIDGKNISCLSRKDISKMIALVPQNPFLIAGTIYENICYGLDFKVPLQEAYDAIKKANLSDFIDCLPEKINTVLSKEAAICRAGKSSALLSQEYF